jgi:hypothetical protein
LNWAAYQRTCIPLMQLSYTGLAVVCLSVFHVVRVGDYGWRLVDHPSLSPDSAAYHQLMPVIILVLSLTLCGIPLAQSVFLLLQYRRGRIHAVKAHRKQPRQEDDGREQAALSSTDALLLQLTASYQLPYFWMSVLVHLRRLVLVALLDALREGSVWIFVTMVNYCLLAVHLYLRPYERAQDNLLESLTLLSLCPADQPAVCVAAALHVPCTVSHLHVTAHRTAAARGHHEELPNLEGVVQQ